MRELPGSSSGVAAIERGVDQVVIIAAGYDGRALRFATPGVQFYEVDHPATQPDKQRRLARIGADTSGVRFVANDVTGGDIATALTQAGFDPAKPALFVCEGLLTYLTRDDAHGLFVGLRQIAAEGSVLLCTTLVRPASVGAISVGRRWVVDLLLRVIGEPRRVEFRPGDRERGLADAGWHATDAADGDRDGRAGRGVLVAAEPGRTTT